MIILIFGAVFLLGVVAGGYAVYEDNESEKEVAREMETYRLLKEIHEKISVK